MYFITGCEEDIKSDIIIIKSILYSSQLKLTDPQYIKEYSNLKANGCECIKTELEKMLNQQGMLLCKKEVDEVLENTDDYFKNCLMLIIMPTESCNFRCIYCYEDHQNKFMERDTVESVKKFLINHGNEYKQISIGWFGGEPTLCKDIILEINELVKKIMDYNQELFMFTITTNGYLLNSDTFIEYYRSGITSYQITIDGWKQDENRPLTNGGKTFDTIIKNLDAIHNLPKQYNFSITIRHNILADDNDVSWYNYLDEKYGDDERFCILVCTVNDMGNNDVKKLNLLKGVQRYQAVDKHVNYIETLKIRSENVSKRSVELGRNLCYASYQNGYVIRADGRIEKCTVFQDHPDNQIGYLDKNGNLIIDTEKNQIWSKLDLTNQCYSCNKVFSCMNKMCPMQRVINGYTVCDEYNRL